MAETFIQISEGLAVERRKFALEKALQKKRVYANYTTEDIIEDAKVFEAFLNGHHHRKDERR